MRACRSGGNPKTRISVSLLYGEFTFRGPGGTRRRARRGGPPTLFSDVPTRQLLAMVWRLLLSQAPQHDPADQPLPDWAATWMRAYDQGRDMTTFFPRSVPQPGR